MAQQAFDAQLERELLVLKAVPGTSGVSASAYSGPDLNKVRVNLYYTAEEGASRKKIAGVASATKPTKLDAAHDAKRKLAAIVGDDVIATAERLVAENLIANGAATSECGAATSSTAPSAFEVLGQTQRLQSELRAAELRLSSELQLVRTAERSHDAARQQVLEAREALERHTKRQRSAPEQVHARLNCGTSAPLPPPDARARRPAPRGRLLPRRRPTTRASPEAAPTPRAGNSSAATRAPSTRRRRSRSGIDAPWGSTASGARPARPTTTAGGITGGVASSARCVAGRPARWVPSSL